MSLDCPLGAGKFIGYAAMQAVTEEAIQQLIIFVPKPGELPLPIWERSFAAKACEWMLTVPGHST